MYYLYDNSHSSGSSEFKKGLLRALENTSNAELFLENVNFSVREKEIKDRILNNLAEGNARINGSKIEDSQNHMEVSQKDLLISKCIRKEGKHIRKVDTGPVFPKELKNSADKISKAQASNKEIDMNLLVKHVVERDLLTAEYISKNCHTPRETIVIMGSTHNLDILLSEKFSIKRMNSRKAGTNREAREYALNYLKEEGHL